MLAIIAFALASAGVGTPQQAVVDTEQQISPENQAAMALAARRGKRLFIYDRIAWTGTDDFFELLDGREVNGGGYVIVEEGGGQTLTFFTNDPDEPTALYRARYRGLERLSSGMVSGDEAVLTEKEKAAIAMRAVALDAIVAFDGVFVCTDGPANFTLLPPTADEPNYLAYLMTPQTDLSRWPVGGHSRAELTPEGEILGVRNFTNSCIDVGGNEDSDGETVGFAVTHLLDPVPTEIHYFTMLASGKFLGVTAGGRVWALGNPE